MGHCDFSLSSRTDWGNGTTGSEESESRKGDDSKGTTGNT
jgi:hypothetical protein